MEAVLADLGSAPDGLSTEEARSRLARYGPNTVGVASRSLNGIVLEQVKNGINLLLAGAGLLTIITGDLPDGAIILALIALNVGLSIVQEYRAEKALEALRHLLPLHCHVKRDGADVDLDAEQLVPGDFVLLGSGDVVPADIRLVDAHDLEVDQATLTGESVPQAKAVAPVNSTRASDWTDVVFAGTTVVGGAGSGVVVATGSRTQFGETASLVKGARAAGDFQVNLSRFAGFLLRFGLVLAAVVFISNALLGRGVLVSLTLALALALGIVPEALPAVTATTLALGARALARKRVLVRRLAAIEDLSAIDTLCIDKTGTITENRTELVDSWSLIPKDRLLLAAVQCSSYPRKGANVIDDALIDAASGLDISALSGEPRKTVMEFSAGTRQMCVSVGDELIYKGAAARLLERCRSIKTPDGVLPLEGGERDVVDQQLLRMQAAGARVLAVAKGAAEASDLTLLGLLAMSDPPRAGAADAMRMATDLGIEVKIVTGDALPRAAALAKQIGLEVPDDAIISAHDLEEVDTDAAAIKGRIFAETVPADKFHLVQTLQRLGRHVAVTGDGVNDAPAMQTADVGIALASGTDATKGAADMVLLEDNLKVIVDGIDEGRRTVTNINRYLLYTMVSNFANVIIVALASLALPFLPLTPGQVLLLNLLADLPMLAIVTDVVAPEDISRPRRWDVRRLVELSIFLGLINAVFAFGLLRIVSTRSAEEIHTVWFLFLGSSALLVLFAVRTRGWFFERPWPSLPVVAAVAAALVVTVALVNVPPSQALLGFGTLSPLEQLGIVAYAVAYLVIADVLQAAFIRAAPAPK
ncbi:MAG TPA: cation-transporting P-type ATPase [Candidatus Dormibacteraeota bacterium]|nr:cation-transporting P-type ATPase [Candidatus Dormibacteraeota bacterium]